MGSFLSSYWASILAAITVAGAPPLLYAFRERLIRGFWELSEDYVREIIPTEIVTETETEEVVSHSREEYRLSMKGSREVKHDVPEAFDTLQIRLVAVDGDHVELVDVGPSWSLYPHRLSELVEGGGRGRRLRVKGNLSRNLRGKLIGFFESTSSVCTVIVHIENVSDDSQTATVVVESFSGRVDGHYEFGLG
jgi:hypothetical protein